VFKLPKLSSAGRTLLAGVTASGTVFGAHWVGLPLLLAAGAGGLAYIGFSLLFQPPTDSASPLSLTADARLILRDATRRVDGLAETSRTLPSSIAGPSAEVVATARQIIVDLTEDARELETGRRFLTHYLDSTQTVLDGYLRLHDRQSGQLTPELELQISGLLKTVANSFRRQKENLLADDVLRLKTEMEVLKRSMEMEG